MKDKNSEKVITYIDGFNLYFGLKEAGYRRFYWLDMVALSRNLLKPQQELRLAKYFTARIAGPQLQDSPDKAKTLEEKRSRQTLFLDALAAQPALQIIEGHYLAKVSECRRCRNRWTKHEEKMTDVNIATHLIVDAFDDAYDTAVIISGDSDLTPPIQAVLSRFPDKRIVVAFPPKRRSSQLEQAANAYLSIRKGTLARSQLDQEVQLPTGYVATRPARWR